MQLAKLPVPYDAIKTVLLPVFTNRNEIIETCFRLTLNRILCFTQFIATVQLFFSYNSFNRMRNACKLLHDVHVSSNQPPVCYSNHFPSSKKKKQKKQPVICNTLFLIKAVLGGILRWACSQELNQINKYRYTITGTVSFQCRLNRYQYNVIPVPVCTTVSIAQYRYVYKHTGCLN